LGSLDSTVLEWMHRHATQSGMAVCLAVSRVGSPIAMTVLAVAGVLLLASLEEWIVLGGWIVAFGGASVLDYWLKLIVHRPRPAYAATLMHHPTWSFPSGHAMGALVGYGMLAYVMLLLGGRSHRTRVLIVAGAALLIAAIGVSRLYLGVHYLSDVVGGYAVGSLWLALCICGVELGRRLPAQRLKLNPRG
jgi:undecaprenyl-diphosphatase